MRRIHPKEVSREGTGSSPPRYAAEALASPPASATPHQIEQDVLRALISHPSLHFSSLVVRRITDGVCLQGVLEVDANSPDVCTVAQGVSGVTFVLNHLLVAGGSEVPAKG